MNRSNRYVDDNWHHFIFNHPNFAELTKKQLVILKLDLNRVMLTATLFNCSTAW